MLVNFILVEFISKYESNEHSYSELCTDHFLLLVRFDEKIGFFFIFYAINPHLWKAKVSNW